MSIDASLLSYVCRLGDNALVLAQRMIESVAAMPDLEEELANANFALDYLGQARMFYSYAGEIEGQGRDEDDLAYQRGESEFQNLLLVEQASNDFGHNVVRLVCFDIFYLAQLNALSKCPDERIAGIAARAEKEIRYHLRHHRQWLIRLGDGTELSHRRTQSALDSLWCFVGEMFAADAIDEDFAERFGGPDLAAIAAHWHAEMASLLDEARLEKPDDGWMDSGGKAGRHTEALGFMLAEMQYLQRTHPGATW